MQGRRPGGAHVVSASRLQECLDLLRAEQERSKRLLAVMNAQEQAASERTDDLRMQVLKVL